MRQDGLRTAVSGGAGFGCLEVKQTRLLTHSTASAVAHTRQERFSLSTAGGGRGRRDCRRGVALQQFIDQPHTPHGASAFPSYSPSGGMDKPTQTKARLADRGDVDVPRMITYPEGAESNRGVLPQPPAFTAAGGLRHAWGRDLRPLAWQADRRPGQRRSSGSCR